MMRTSTKRLAAAAAPFAVAMFGLTGQPAAQDTFKIGMAVGGHTCCEWMKVQGDVARALAEERGWDYIELSNNNDPADAVKNAQIFVQEGVDVVIQFNPQPSSNPAVFQVLDAADIPVITYDIAHEGMYFVGIDNLAAGIAGGEALGAIMRDEWNCESDLVIAAHAAAAGIVDEWRTGGMVTGVQNICPDIAEDKFVEFESTGATAPGIPAARDLLAAHPDAERMAVVGINDGGVLSAIQAAEQLGRDEQMIGWGQDGAFITGDNVNPRLLGSVFYFLEGYAVYAFRDIIDPIAAGNPPEVKWDAGDPASQIEPCPVSAEQAATVPDMAERFEQLVAAADGTTAYELFCPAS